MKKKICFVIATLWCAFNAYIFPLALGWIFMDITGHSKGYSYDLGPEKSVSVMLGFFELFMWIILVVPANVYFFRRVKRIRKWLVPVVIVIYILLSLFFIYYYIGDMNWSVGFYEFIRCFGYKK